MMEEYTDGEKHFAKSQVIKLTDPFNDDFENEDSFIVACNIQCHLNRANELLRIVKNATFTPSRFFKVVSEYLDTQKEAE